MPYVTNSSTSKQRDFRRQSLAQDARQVDKDRREQAMKNGEARGGDQINKKEGI